MPLISLTNLSLLRLPRSPASTSNSTSQQNIRGTVTAALRIDEGRTILVGNRGIEPSKRLIRLLVFVFGEHRLAEVARIHDKYPDRIRVIVKRVEMSDIPDIDKKKQVILRARNLKQLANFIRSSRWKQGRRRMKCWKQ
ncbi:riboflavin kinase [Dionaea muscipula]